MKMKKILAGITAVVLTASVSGISVYAENIPTEVIKTETSDGAKYNDLTYTIRTNSYGEKYVEITDCSTTAVSVIIPDTIEGYPVTSIGGSAFYGCSSLTSINIPSSVTGIGVAAFYGCSSLTSINIPSSVTSIGGSAFEGCSSITSINIPSSVTSIGDAAFYGCSSLTSTNIPSSVTSIGGSAFSGCSSLTSINIPSSVTSIGSYAFYGCSFLTSISIPSSVTTIGACAFYGCSSLTSINIPSSVTSIGDAAFYGCSSLTSTNIPSSVTTINNDTFHGCSSLTSINISSSVTTIGDSAFYLCSSLTSINIPSSVITIGNDAFSGCHSLTSINIPSSVTKIYGNGIRSCKSLRAVAFSSKDIYLCDHVFSNCYELKHVHIPKGSVYTDFYRPLNGLPSDPSCYYEAEGEGTCSLGKKCPFLYDELLEQYTIKVIDKNTGDVYVNAIVKSEDGKYSAVTDETGRALFDIADNDEYFWNNDIVFEVYFDETTHLSSEVVVSLGYPFSSNETMDKNSAPTKAGQKTTVPTNNSQQTIIISRDKMIKSVSYKGENVLASKAHKKPVGAYRRIFVNESYDTVSKSPTHDKLSIDFADEIVGQGYKVQIYVTDAKEMKSYIGNQEVTKYQDVLIYENEIGKNKSMVIDSFSDLITKKMNDDHAVKITLQSRVRIAVIKSGESITADNNYYLTPDLGVYSDVQIMNMGLLDGKRLQGSLGQFNADLPIPENDYFEASMFLDLSKNQVGLEAALGLNIKDKNYESDSKGEYDFDSLKDAIENAGDLDFKKQFEQIKNQKFDEAYGFYLKPMAKINAAGTIHDTNIELEGALQAGLDVGFTGTWRIPQLANLAHIDAAVSVEGMATAAFENYVITRVAYKDILDLNKPFNPEVTIDLSATGSLGAGIGIGSLVDASLEASLTGETSYAVRDAVWKNICLKGEVIAKEKILCYEATQELAGAEFQIVDDDGNSCGYMKYSLAGNETEHECTICGKGKKESSVDKASCPEVLSASDFKLIPRNSEGEQMVSELSYDCATGADGSSFSAEQIIAKNVYAVSDPVIVNAGGTEYMFRFIDNTNRSAANGSTLVYSKNVSGTWSEPVMIADDGTADFDVSVCTDGTDIYLSWCNISEQISDEALYTDAIAKTTISVAKLDTATDSVTLIGTAKVDGKSSLTPSVSVKNGTGIVAWVSNSQYDPLNYSGNDNIYYSTISNGTLSAPKLYASTGSGKNAGVVETGYIGSDLCIVYGCMESGGMAETSELYGSVYTSSPVLLTNNSVPDSNPQFEKLNGQDMLFWYRNGDIVYSDSLGGEARTALSGITGDKYAIASSDDVTKIAWREKTDEGYVLKMSAYEGGEFSNNYIANDLGDEPSMFTATLDSSNMFHIAYTYLDGDKYTLALTSEVEDEKAVVTYAVPDSSYKAGDKTIELSIGVFNSGNRDLDSAAIAISDGAGNVIGTYPIEDFNLKIGESKDITINAVLPEITDYTTFTVSLADIECESAMFEVGFTELYLTGDVYEAGNMRFADITVHNDSTVATSGSLAVIVDGTEVARSQLSTIDCNANSLNAFNLSELMDGNDFTEVKFVLEGTKQGNFAGSTTLEYTFDKQDIEPEAPVIQSIEVTSNKVIVSYFSSESGTTTMEYDFDLVTEELVEQMKSMDIQYVIDFVNAFSEAADEEAVLLTSAQIKAIEYVLEYDFR